MLACRLSDVQTEDRHIVVIEAAVKKVLEPRASELIRTAGLHRDPRDPRDQCDECDEARVYVTISTTLFCPDFWKHWRTAATEYLTVVRQCFQKSGQKSVVDIVT